MDIKKVIKNNNLINAGLCLGSVIIFGFNPLAIGACYIGSDILLTAVNLIYEKNVVRKAAKEGTFDEVKSNIFSYESNNSLSNKTLKVLGNLEKKVKKAESDFLEQQKKQAEEEEAQIKKEISRRYRGYDNVIDTINEFLSFYENYKDCERSQKVSGLKKIQKEFKQLKIKLDKKPEASGIVSGCFYTYTKELIDLLVSYKDVPSERMEKYQEKYQSLLNEFYLFLCNTNQLVDECIIKDTDLNLEVLLQELKEINNTRRDESSIHLLF